MRGGAWQAWRKPCDNSALMSFLRKQMGRVLALGIDRRVASDGHLRRCPADSGASQYALLPSPGRDAGVLDIAMWAGSGKNRSPERPAPGHLGLRGSCVCRSGGDSASRSFAGTDARAARWSSLSTQRRSADLDLSVCSTIPALRRMSILLTLKGILL